MNIKKAKSEIIYWAKALNQRSLVSAKNGNISYRIGKDKILITTHDACLGHLEEKEILLVDSAGNVLKGSGGITTEKNLHLSIYRKFSDIKVVLHSHPTHTIAFFHYFERLNIFSFEAKLYLGDISALPQKTPAVAEIEPVLKALENNNIVALRDHGVVSAGGDFKEAFGLVELLEEQAKVNLFIRGTSIDQGEPQPANPINAFNKTEGSKKKYRLLSKEHLDRLTELVNHDKEAQELGQKYDLTCTLAIKNQESQEAACFHYEKGKIIKVEANDLAEFVIIGKEEILKKVFNKEIDPFVASTQGKVKTRGDFTKMSRWYPVLVRTFKLWEEAPVY